MHIPQLENPRVCLATLLTLCRVHLQAPFRHGILTSKIKGYNAEMRSYDDIEVSVKVTGSKTLENGLVLPGTFKTRTPNRAIDTKFERGILWAERTLRPH